MPDTSRVLVYSKNDAHLLELTQDEVLSRTRTETLNGEHALTIETSRMLDKGWRVLTWDGRWREWVVSGIDDEHASGKHPTGKYYCTWSLQHDLLVTRTNKQPGTKTPVNATAALQAALSETTRWEVGTVDVATTGGASMYKMSAWEALSVVVETWGGEIDATITVDAEGVISRAVDLRQKLGHSYVTRRFEWGHDVQNITRTITDDPNACRIVPLGSSVETEGGGYSRRITIESVNGGLDYLQNDVVVNAYRLPKPGGGWEYPTIQVENQNAKTPAELKAWGLSVLEEYTTPKITYKASVYALKEAGLDFDDVTLGDAVHIVDRGFEGEGLRLDGRITKITVNELVDGDVTVELGSLAPTLADTIGGITRAAYAAQSAADAAQSAADKLSENFWVDDEGNVHVTKDLEMSGGLTWGAFKAKRWVAYATETWANATEAEFSPRDTGYNVLVDETGIHLRG